MKTQISKFSALLIVAVIISCGSSKKSGPAVTGTESPVPVTSLTINKTETTVLLGNSETLYAQVWSINATNQDIAWSSSDTSIVKVSASGEIYGVAEGKAVITAESTDGNRTATTAVSVATSPVSVASVAIRIESRNIGINSSLQLYSTFSPQNSSNQIAVWTSSDSGVISISKGGVITGIKSGTSVITVTSADGSKTALMTITVSDVPVESISLNKTSTVLDVNGTEQLGAVISPSDASTPDLDWKSSDGNIVSVSSTGFITGIGAGSAAITAESISSGKKAECSITVNAPVPVGPVSIPVSGITIQNAAVPAPFNVGGHGTITVTIAPLDASNQSVTWSSSESAIVYVNQTGTITAMSVGTAFITAASADGKFSVTYTVTVDPVPVTGISITSNSSSVKVGSTVTLTAGVSPTDATYNTMTWTSSNTSAATVDFATGKVTGVATGQTTITALSADGKFSSSVTIYVSEAKASDDTVSLQQGSTTTIAASALIANDTGSQLTFSAIVAGSEVNCSVSISGSILSITSTGVAGEAANFQYQITDIAGGKATATVYLSVSALASISAYIYEDETLFNAKKAAYIPPTMSSIFNSWGRFNGTNSFWSNGPAATGDAATWTLIADENNDGLIDSKSAAFFDSPMGNKPANKTRIYGDLDADGVFDARVMQTANTNELNGFISPETFENYTMEGTLWSSDPSDDDMLGIIAAFYHTGAVNGSGGSNQALYFARTRGGWAPNKTWGLMLNTTVIVNIPVDGVAAGSNWGGTYTGTLDTDGSNDSASRIKIIRSGDIITAYCTNWMTGVTNFRNPPAYNAVSMIEINLASTTDNIRYYSAGVTTYASQDLTAFRGSKSYGYVTQSSAMSTYLDVVFSGGLKSDTLILLKNKDTASNIWNSSEVWKYASGAWAFQSSSTIQSELGFVRSASNPETSLTYSIKRFITER